MNACSGRRPLIHGGNRDEIDVVNRELTVTIHKINAAAACAVHGRDVELHHLRMGGHGPGTALQHEVEGRAGIAHPQGNGRDGGHIAAVGRTLNVKGVDHDVELALAVEQHLTRTVPRHGPKTHHLQHLAECLGFGSGVLDELDAVQAQRVRGIAERGLQGLTAIHRAGQQITHGNRLLKVSLS